MGFKKLVSLACDGPCGTVLPQTEKAPEGWAKLTVNSYEKLAQGQKPSRAPKSAWLCAKCTLNLTRIMNVGGFTLNEGHVGSETEGQP